MTPTTLLPVSRAVAGRAAGTTLSPEEKARFSRHILLPEVGIEGQTRLKAARILVIGAGGLGSPVSLYLAAAGVGTIGLADHDTVDTSNLQRQILYTEKDQGRPKVEAARERLNALSSRTVVEVHQERVDAGNVERIVAPYDIVIDGTDNFPTRYLVNDACVLLGKPNVHGSIFRFDGQASVFYPPHGPCYRCLFPAPPPPGQVPSCAEGGVLGVLPAQIGAIQANEAVKLALGIGEPLIGRLLTLDALGMRVAELRFRKDRDCPVCGEHPTITRLEDAAASCVVSALSALRRDELLSVADYRGWREAARPHVLLDVRSPAEAMICAIGGSVLIPLPDLERQLGRLDPQATIVVHCKSGARSASALQVLRGKGFKQVLSLDGGIVAWIDQVDAGLTRY